MNLVGRGEGRGRGGGEILHPVASLPFNLYRAPVSIVDESKISINRACILVSLGTVSVLCLLCLFCLHPFAPLYELRVNNALVKKH